ncbi:MAG: hypothetical protein ABH824_02865 [Nanoarchaeota archaeon]|nr:hypothetical protein [Nanoarchaeota archaeon]MBU1632081.1 hypothetical protein [Nanoarchaeota archaeon]MBU1875715.1 hypothetical protein [Nanoarchaeota archaeon]
MVNKKVIAISGLATCTIALFSLPLSLYDDGKSVIEHNENKRIEKILPYVQERLPGTTLYDISTSPTTYNSKCIESESNEPIIVHFQEKSIGTICLQRKIDEEKIRELWEQSTPVVIPYEYTKVTVTSWY